MDCLRRHRDGGLKGPFFSFQPAPEIRRNVIAPNIPPASSTVDFDFHALVALAEQFGLEGPNAFLWAMLLRANGVNAGEAVMLFRAASRWIQ
jgi:hypothetical protein